MNRRIPLIAGAVVVTMLLGWYLAVWRPASSHLASARSAQSAAQARQAVLDSQLARLVALQRALPSTERQLRDSEPVLPVAVSVDTAIDQINAIAIHNGVSWTNESQSVTSTTSSGTSSSTGGAASSSTETGSGGGNATLSLTMTVAGSYGGMGSFVTALQHTPRLVVVDALTYTPTKHGVSVSLSARAFYDSTSIPAIPKVGAGS